MEKPDIELKYEDCKELKRFVELSDNWRVEIKQFLQTWTGEKDNKPVTVSWSNETYTYGEILRHVIAHEIHHIGQLSIWAKVLDVKIVSTNFIGRGL